MNSDERALDDETRRAIAGRARTMAERLAGPPNEPGDPPPIDPGELLDRWEETYPDEETFRDRLAQEGIDRDRVSRAAARTRFPADEPLPAWIDTLDEIVRHVEATPPAGGWTAGEPVAFDGLVRSLVDYAVTRIDHDLPDETALRPVFQTLAARLARLTRRPLYVEFMSYLEHEQPELIDADATSVETAPTENHEAFVAAMHEFGFRNLCREYPVLARLVTTVLTTTVETVHRELRRLDRDRDRLEARFGVSGPVRSIEPLADDTHHGGQRPLRIEFETGSAVYKPRPVDAGEAFHTLLDRLTRASSLPSVETPTYLSRAEYGWMEPVDPAAPPDAEAVPDYYRRAGVVACVAYTFNCTDFQLENVVAAGRQPTVVDAETLCHAVLDPTAIPKGERLVRFLNETVLDAALFPFVTGDPLVAESDTSRELAGFGADSSPAELPGSAVTRLRNPNTDLVSVERRPSRIDRADNTLSTDDRDFPPQEYVEAILDGFERTYDEMMRRGPTGIAELVPWERLEELDTRVLFRNTSSYATAKRSTVARDPLRDGVAFSIETESLAADLFAHTDSPGEAWSVYEAERRALLRRDVPRFTTSPGRTVVRHDGEPIGMPVEQSGLDATRTRIAELSQTDRARQRRVIAASLGAHETPTHLPDRSASSTSTHLPDRSASSTSTHLPDRSALSTPDFLETARAAFEHVLDQADRPYGLCSFLPVGETATLRPAGRSLYYGYGGAGIAAAALARTTGRARYRETAQSFLDRLVGTATDEPFVHGGTRGTGSVVYALSVGSELLDDDRLRAAATTHATRLTDERIRADESFELMEGVAGTLLALVAHYRRTGDERLRELARRCGDHLIESASLDGVPSWDLAADTAPTGFAHGVTGIACALVRLASVTETDRYESVAERIYEYESTLYDPETNNWDRSRSSPTQQDRWCHGRSGIVMGRLTASAVLGHGLLPDDEAVARLGRDERQSPDGLCCGYCGTIEARLLAGRHDGVSADRAAADRLAAGVIQRQREAGGFALPGHNGALVTPTLFDGVSGVTYTLARLAAPDTVPSVLTFE